MSGARTDFPTSPLAPSFERMADFEEKLYLKARLGVPHDEDGWTPFSGLVEDREFFREKLLLYRKKWDLGNYVSAIGFVGNVAWRVGGAALFFYAAERRVPDLSPENLSLRLVDGSLGEVAFASGRYAALSKDPAAEKAVSVFESEDGLRDWMREGLERMLDPVITEVRAATRVGKRTLYNRAADLLAQRFMGIGEAIGDRLWCGCEAERLVKASGSPLNGATKFFTIEHEGREEVYFVRGCCCHAYKDPQRGYCGSCPLLSQEERERLAVEEMAG